MNQAILATVLGFLFTLCAAAADAPPEPASAATPIVLKAAHLFDGKNGQLQSPGIVVVQGQRIVAVGSNTQAPAGARLIDLGDATLLPGFIDAHTHIAGDYYEGWADAFYGDTLRSVPEQSFHALRNARALLMAGVTSLREVGTVGGHEPQIARSPDVQASTA